MTDEEELVISRYLFTFKYPIDLGIATAPILKAAETGINAGYEKTKRISKAEGLPEPKKTVAGGLVLIECYMAKGLIKEFEIDLFTEVRKFTRKFRLPAIDANKLDLLKAVGVEWGFEELEVYKPKEVEEK